MTLKIDQYLVNLVKKEAEIGHNNVKIWGGKKDKLRQSVQRKIKDEYGESFLEDADYILFFRSDDLATDDGVKRLFKTVNRALGKNANSMSESDFKKINKTVDSDEEKTDQALDFVFVKITLN